VLGVHLQLFSKLRLKICLPLGVQVHPLHPLATPMLQEYDVGTRASGTGFFYKKNLKIQLLDSQSQQKIVAFQSNCVYCDAIVCTWPRAPAGFFRGGQIHSRTRSQYFLCQTLRSALFQKKADFIFFSKKVTTFF